MGSALRVRTRQSFGFGLFGTTYQHCYELAHMVPDNDSDTEDSLTDGTEELMQQFYEVGLPAIHLVEKISLHFSEQFCHRLTWSSRSGDFPKLGIIYS